MSNAVTTTQPNVFEAYSNAVNRRLIVGQLLKFRKGEWSVGQNDDEIVEGAQFVCNMDELTVGWVKWEDFRPVEHVMGKVSEGFVPPLRKTLGDSDEKEWALDDRGERRDPWQLTNYLLLKAVGGDQLYTYAGSSKGAINAIGELSGIYGKALRQRPREFPVVAIGSDFYKAHNKAIGKVYYPTFTVVGWAPKAEFVDVLAADAAATPDDAADEPAVEAAPERPKSARNGGKKVQADTRF